MKTKITLKKALLEEAETTYAVTEKLFSRVTDADLSWKPATGKNWMTVGQLLMHAASYGCGKAVKGFVKGDWGEPESASDDHGTDQHVPPAEALPSVASVSEALEILAEDKKLTVRCIRNMKEPRLLRERTTAPWGGRKLFLFQHLSMMIEHLAQHKGQLFYYLKLMGRDVNTSDLWGG